MELKRRSWLKAVTWQALGLITSIMVSFAFTGNLSQSLGLSLALAGTGLVMYALHERLWQRINWGRIRTP